MMISVGIIGFGRWGKTLHQKLIKMCHVKFICGRNDNYLGEINKVEWVVVATPNETHYQIVSDCLKLGKHVFCEKPLTLTEIESIKLYQLAEKNNAYLYVSDVQNYIDIDYDFLKHNFVKRYKKAGNSDYKIKDLLYRLAYHDIYFLYRHIKNLPIHSISCLNNQDKLQFIIEFDNGIDIDFLYNVEYDNGVKHYINKTNLREVTFDPLSKMLKGVLFKEVDFQKNKEMTLFTNNIIDKVNEKI